MMKGNADFSSVLKEKTIVSNEAQSTMFGEKTGICVHLLLVYF